MMDIIDLCSDSGTTEYSSIKNSAVYIFSEEDISVVNVKQNAVQYVGILDMPFAINVHNPPTPENMSVSSSERSDFDSFSESDMDVNSGSSGSDSNIDSGNGNSYTESDISDLSEESDHSSSSAYSSMTSSENESEIIAIVYDADYFINYIYYKP